MIAIWTDGEGFVGFYAVGNLALDELAALIRLDGPGWILATVPAIELVDARYAVEEPFAAVARALWIPHSDDPAAVDRWLGDVPTLVLARLVEVARRESPPDRVAVLVEALERRRGEGVGCG